MNTREPGPRRGWQTLTAAWILFAAASTAAHGGDTPGVCPSCHKTHAGRHAHAGNAAADGFQGFGLGYHLGYGYGGTAFGVGHDGGYPFYGGPGYPHPAPSLRRFGGITPFPYFGGPGGPTPTCRNYFAPTGPLVGDTPVVTIAPEPGEGDYGSYTGVLPYPESAFATFTTSAGTATPAPAPTGR